MFYNISKNLQIQQKCSNFAPKLRTCIMKTIRKIGLFFAMGALLSMHSVSFAASPKRELRATWIATVNNIDWPVYSTVSGQQNEMIRMLDSIAALHMNAVFFQVRPCADALYNSAYEPWSSFLRVSRGTNPGYDPLQFVIDEGHKRGIAVHAWMNPYRYSRTGARWTGANDTPLNYEHTHPEWLLYYSSNIVLDPGLPEVRQRICDVVGDLLSKYDVDGIIFDDYFYPYGGTTNQDSTSQRLYKPAGMDVHDWRRDNVNRMVQDVYDTIQAVKPWVTFGISPFGIWTTSYTVAQKEGITLPSGISGGNMYQEIYCDPVAWLRAGSVDYISPQLYWRTNGPQSYNVLCPWWANLCNQFGKHFYSSMAVYKYAESTQADHRYYTVSELQNETNINRSSSQDNAPGTVFYNTKAWVYDKPYRDAFRADQFHSLALPPAINWKPAQERTMVTFLEPVGDTLRWTHPDKDVHFAIYAVSNTFRNRVGIFSQGEALIGICYDTCFVLPQGITLSSYKIGVSVLDGYNNEYSLRIYGEETEQPVVAHLTAPEMNKIFAKWPVTFRWDAVSKADSYVLQIARDQDFQDIVVTQELTGTAFNSAVRRNLKENGEYFWRIKVRKANCDDVWTSWSRFYVGDYSPIPENAETPSLARPGVYNIQGMYLGTTTINLPKGVYIVNGKKMIL